VDIRIARPEVAPGTGAAAWAMTAARSTLAATSVETDHQVTAEAPPVAAPTGAAPSKGIVRLAAVDGAKVQAVAASAGVQAAAMPAAVEAHGTDHSTFRSYRFSTLRSRRWRGRAPRL
jgi:hypothetical protein